MGAVPPSCTRRDPSVAGIVLDSPFSSPPRSCPSSSTTSSPPRTSPRRARGFALGWMRAHPARAGLTYTTWTCFERWRRRALFAHGADDDFIRPAHSRRRGAYAEEKEFSSSTATTTRRGRRPSSTPRSSSSPERCTRVWTVWAGAGWRVGDGRGVARGSEGTQSRSRRPWRARSRGGVERADTPTSFTAATRGSPTEPG